MLLVPTVGHVWILYLLAGVHIGTSLYHYCRVAPTCIRGDE